MNGEPWTDERISLALKMWADGSSASEISRKLHVSRSAVLGKLHRLGAPKRSEEVALINIRRLTPKQPKQPRAAKAPRKPPNNFARRNMVRRLAARDPGLPAEPTPTIDYTHAKPWTERAFGECAFPIGAGGDLLSCAAPTKEGRTYCPACEGVMFQPEQPTKRSTMRLARLAA